MSERDTPLLSVVVPAFNSMGTLSRCLESIEVQKNNRIEVIVIDDGSTDDTSVFLEQWCLSHDGFRYFVQPNAGPFLARLNGLRFANGEYVVFADADDFFLPSAFGILNGYLGEQRHSIVLFSYYEEQLSGTRVLKTRGPFGNEIEARHLLLRALTSDEFNPLYSCLIPRKSATNAFIIAQQSGAGNMKHGEDAMVMMHLLNSVSTVSVHEYPIYVYSHTEGSLTHRTGIQDLMSTIADLQVLFSERLVLLKENGYNDGDALTRFSANRQWHVRNLLLDYLAISGIDESESTLFLRSIRELLASGSDYLDLAPLRKMGHLHSAIEYIQLGNFTQAVRSMKREWGMMRMTGVLRKAIKTILRRQ